MTTLRGKRCNCVGGFTIIELLVVVSILSVLASVIVINIGSKFGSAEKSAYETTRHEIELAVTDYIARSHGELPVIDDTVQIDGENLNIINMCALLNSYEGGEGPGILRKIPASCVDTIVDNCAGEACGDITACDPNAHYIWAADDDGMVKSTCVGSGCDANDADGYQGVYP